MTNEKVTLEFESLGFKPKMNKGFCAQTSPIPICLVILPENLIYKYSKNFEKNSNYQECFT